MSELSIWAERALTPERSGERVRLRAREGRIVDVVTDVDPADGDKVFADATLVPGLIDLQVNGGNGVAFDAQDADERARAVQFHLRNGTTSLLATLVSAPLDHLQSALARLAFDVDAAGPLVGVHLEGPFLNEDKCGAHDAGQLADPTSDAVEDLLRSSQGTLRMLTLAPEREGALEAIRTLHDSGVIVAAGHTRATHAELTLAIEAGLSFVTHVGNASEWPTRSVDPERGFRRSEPGVIGTFLFDERLSGSLILDGWHLHPGLARALVELRGAERLVLVSDATPAAGLAPGRYVFGGLDAEVHVEGYATSGESLAGSVIPLRAALRVAIEQALLSPLEAVRMATLTPAQILGIDDRKGALLPGHDADLLLLASDWSVRAVYQNGRRV